MSLGMKYRLMLQHAIMIPRNICRLGSIPYGRKLELKATFKSGPLFCSNKR
jgi:hypothetical protein